MQVMPRNELVIRERSQADERLPCQVAAIEPEGSFGMILARRVVVPIRHGALERQRQWGHAVCGVKRNREVVVIARLHAVDIALEDAFDPIDRIRMPPQVLIEELKK